MTEEKVGQEQLIICGGCNAKIGAGYLSEILADLPKPAERDENLLVGFDSADDASVYKISDDVALIQSVDFFPTMVSDPYLFGRIAATNALSDIYAMGGEVFTALNIVMFPEEKNLNILKKILEGGADAVHEAGATLSGGHSINATTPKYGLSVSGKVHPDKIIRNDTAEVGDALILTKPLGVGIVTTAYSVSETTESAFQQAVKAMTTLNKYAADIMKNFTVHSCTDITGFGLLGHLNEMLHDQFSAEIKVKDVPFIPEAYECAREFLVTAGGQKNRNYLEDKVVFDFDDYALEEIFYDPQTSGGLLISVPQAEADQLVKALNQSDKIDAQLIGHVVEKRDKAIYIS
ncbi:MAG: selenide, water dikinase SelD [Aerococcus sp.]|nr:selenide, water dikinase SelD [Aerococcus sp.]